MRMVFDSTACFVKLLFFALLQFFIFDSLLRYCERCLTNKGWCYWFVLQVADSGWYRYQQTVGVWHSAASGSPLWEDRGSTSAAGCKSTRLSLLPTVCCLSLMCLQKQLLLKRPASPQLSKFTPQHLAFVPPSCVMKPVGYVCSLHKNRGRLASVLPVVQYSNELCFVL